MSRKRLKEVKIQYDNYGKPYTKLNIKLYLETYTKLKNYVNAVNQPKTKNFITMSDVISSALSNYFKDKILDNTFIELERPIYFNLNDLIENRVVTATTLKFHVEPDGAIVVEKIPNNLDDFNASKKTYCQGDETSKHAGVYILPNLDGGDDYLLVFNYDLTTQEYTVRLTNDKIDYYFDNLNKDEMKYKETLVSKANDFKVKYKNNELTKQDLNKYGIYNWNILSKGDGLNG